VHPLRSRGTSLSLPARAPSPDRLAALRAGGVREPVRARAGIRGPARGRGVVSIGAGTRRGEVIIDNGWPRPVSGERVPTRLSTASSRCCMSAGTSCPRWLTHRRARSRRMLRRNAWCTSRSSARGRPGSW